VAALVGAAYLSRARRRADATGSTLTDVLAHDLRGFVTHRFDPLVVRLGLAGGRRSPWGLLEHVGRTTGSVHRTPVTPRVHGTTMMIPLPYGTDVQWVRNVQAAGHCRVQLHETIFELDEPAIIMAEQNPSLPRAAHEILDETAAHYLRLHILDRAPGVFADPPTEFTTHPIPTDLPDIEIAHEVHAAVGT
jgi:deazaflavin-dependent oxidoreductase (nitroreductase family)